MTTPLLPNSELVGMGWLIAAVTRITSAKVATSLPDPPWPDDEFCQIMQVGGTPDNDLPIQDPVISVNCFAMKKNSLKPPWGQAANLAMQIWEATFAVRYAPDPAVLVAMPVADSSAYGTALVRSVTAMSTPRRVPSDPSQFAVYNLDLLVDWVPVGMVVARH